MAIKHLIELQEGRKNNEDVLLFLFHLSVCQAGGR